MGVHRARIPKCSAECDKEDPGRFAGVVRLKNRIFEWYCCPTVRCLHIGEWPERRTVSETEELEEIMALKLFAQILKGERPWSDLALVERLMPEAV